MKYLFFSVAIVLVNVSTAQRVTTNRQYQTEEIRTISFTPYFDERGNPNQDFNGLFEEALSSTFDVCCQRELEHNILNHIAFNELSANVLYTDLSALVRTKSNLFNSLNKTERLELQNGCKNTDLIAILSKIDSRTVSKLNNTGNITVSGSITVFDLRTGEFVAFITDEIKKKFGDITIASPPLHELVNSLITGLNDALEK